MADGKLDNVTTLRFLGTSDSQGVPRWWCDCTVCTEARDTGLNARTRPSVLLEHPDELILIDPSPEFRLQISKTNLRRLSAVLITHAHNDHILGLGDVGDYARWTRQIIPIYAPAEVLAHVKERFPYMTRGDYLHLCPFRVLETCNRRFAGFQVSCYRVPHGFNGWAFGFLLEGAHRWAYVPDSIGIQDLAPWQQLDTLVLGTSFYHETADYHTRSIYDVQEAMALLAELLPKRTVFTHLGHGIDRRKDAPEGTCYAFDGMSLELV